MSDNSQKRRDFLKTAAMGAAGAVGLTALKFDKAQAQTTGGWVDGMQINPAIDNKRVISCHDTKMLNSTPSNTQFTTTNNAVNAAVVATNLDQMAMLLAQKGTPTEAWSTIFRSGKPWASTRVAMKTNGIGGSTTNRPKWAIYKKLCEVLVGLGVKPANIVLYDNCDNAATYYDAYTSLTDATKIQAAPTSVRAAGLGGFKAVTLTSTTSISCAADLVDGNIDILVNVAACKSHNGTGGKYNYGSCTLCMKNHFGTFTDGTKAQYSNNLHVANSGANPPPTPAALFEINKHSAVLGGTPVRQQLCIVDALLSNGGSGPGGGWDNRTDRLVMGTFAPIVDYFSAKNILLNTAVMTSSAMPALGVTNAAIILPQFLTSFGYAVDTVGSWIEYDPATGVPAGNGGASGSGGTNGTGGSNGTGGKTGSGGSSGSGGANNGGANATGGKTGSGGASGSGGSGNGGASASGGSGSGGASASGGSGSGGSGSGGSGSGGSGSGGTTTAGGTTASNGGSASMGGSSTSVPSASGGAAMGGSSAVTGQSGSSGGCDIGGLGRKATPLAALLGLGAVAAGKLRRLVTGGSESDPKPPSHDDEA